MKKLLLLCLPALLFVSCNNKRAKNEILTPANLKSQLFTINPEQDNVLRTAHASILRISKGTFKVKGPVSIEIKEAFTPSEILIAGMTTTSDGKPLRSAGMLYFNATAEGKTIEPSLPIKTTIPAKDADEHMQLFKGEEENNGTINWVDPQALDTAKPAAEKALYERGRALFLGKCGSCHSIFNETAYPALRDFQYRGPWKNPDNILRWLRNPPRFTAYDKYTQDLKAKFGSLMTAFPDLTMEDVKGLLVYIKSVEVEEKRPNSATTPAAPKSAMADTTTNAPSSGNCGTDTIYTSTTNDFAEYDTTPFPDVYKEDTTSAGDPSIRDYYNEGYDFNIDANGWYNIDQYVKTTDELKNVALTADLLMKEKAYMNVYVFLPSERMMQQATGRKGDLYTFDFEEGRIPLPLRYRAIIFAFGTIKDKIIYGVTEFTIKNEQVIPVEIKETTKEGLMNLLHTKNINGVQIEAIEKKMEILKKPCPGTNNSENDYQVGSADIVDQGSKVIEDESADTIYKKENN